MSMETPNEMMNNYPPSIAATKKVKGVLPANFAWYSFEWLGDTPDEWDVMKVTGSTFCIANSGKNKGRPIKEKGGIKKTVYVTASDIADAKATGGAV